MNSNQEHPNANQESSQLLLSDDVEAQTASTAEANQTNSQNTSNSSSTSNE